MPNRIIRDACRTSPSLASLSDLAERTFWRLIVSFDDFGRYHGSSLALLAAAYPVPPPGLTAKRFDAALAELERADLIRFYESGGRQYVHSPTWSKYQRLRARNSQYPEPLCSLAGGHRAVISPPVAAGVGVGNGDGNDPPITPPKPGRVLDGFDAFWNDYPKSRRKGRYEAESAWRKLRPSPETSARIMASLAAWKSSDDWLKDGGKFIPWPQKFLNKHRWEEIPDPGRRGPDELEGL